MLGNLYITWQNGQEVPCGPIKKLTAYLAVLDPFQHADAVPSITKHLTATSTLVYELLYRGFVSFAVREQ